MLRAGVALERRIVARSILRILALIVFVSGCSSSSWRHLELGDVFDVRGRQLVMRGDETLTGSVVWGLGLEIPPHRAPNDVRRARFGVGTAARWTLRGDGVDGASWPTELEVARAVWDLWIDTDSSVRHHRFDLPAGQRLVRSLPCDAAICSYVFAETDAHRDVFTLEAVAGRYEAIDALLGELQSGLAGTVWLSLRVEVHPLRTALPRRVEAALPLAPSGVSVEFRP